MTRANRNAELVPTAARIGSARRVVGAGRMTALVVGLVLGLVLVLLGAHTAHAAVRRCDPHRTARLDINAAARTPSIGRGAARKLAREIEGAPICGAPASGWVRSRLGRIAAVRDRSLQDRLMRALLDSIRAHRYRASATLSGYPTSEAALAIAVVSVAQPCELDRTIHIHLRDARQVADYLAVAAEAEALGDSNASGAALAGARGAYTQWAGVALKSGTSIGDFVTVASGAEELGLDGLAARAITSAQGIAVKHYEEIRSQMDPCFPTKHDLGCQARAAAAVMMLGAESLLHEDLSSSLNALAHAVAHGDAVAPCRTWAFTMKLTAKDTVTGEPWSMRWEEGRFRLDATKERFAALKQTWPGSVDNDNSRCILEENGVRSDLGPATVVGGPFHYSIAGSLTSNVIALSLSSQDATISISASNQLCQGMAKLFQPVIETFVKGPLELPFPVKAGQTSAAFHEDIGEGGSFEATLRQLS